MRPAVHTLAGLGLLLLATTARAEPTSTVRPELLLRVQDAPTLAAASRRVDAARERIEAAGRFPDPEVEGMLSEMDGPMGESSTMYELALRQPLPKRGERSAARERARAALAMSEAEFAVMAGELAGEVAMALAEAEGAHQRSALLETQLGRLDAVLRAIEIQLSSSNNSRLADRLTVQSRIASMQLMIEEARRRADDAHAEIRGRLGLAPDAELPAYAAPELNSIDPERSARVKLAAARASEAEAMVRMAQASARPMTAVGLRFERERMAMGDEDTVGVAFMSEIPWRGRRYAKAEARAAQADRAAAQADATAVRHRARSALARVARAERLAELARRLSQETLQRLNAEYESMIGSAGVTSTGGSTVLQLVELLEKATEAELQVIEAVTAARVARAELWTYADPARFTLNTF